MSNDDVDDLLGVGPPPAPKDRGGRPTRAETAAKLEAASSNIIPKQAFVEPMTAPQLAQVFDLDVKTVRRRLQLVRSVGLARNNAPQYRFLDAAPHLIPPVDIDGYIQDMNPDDLPNTLRLEYWSAMVKRQVWEENAGELWRTDDVLKVFGETFITIKSALKLHVATLNQSEALTPTARAALVTMQDQLMADLHERLLKMPKLRRTRSQIALVEDAPTAEVAPAA